MLPPFFCGGERGRAAPADGIRLLSSPFCTRNKGSERARGQFVYINYSRRAERNKVIDLINFGVQMLSEVRRSRAGEGEIAVACANYPARVFLLSFAERGGSMWCVRTLSNCKASIFKRHALVEPVDLCRLQPICLQGCHVDIAPCCFKGKGVRAARSSRLCTCPAEPLHPFGVQR